MWTVLLGSACGAVAVGDLAGVLACLSACCRLSFLRCFSGEAAGVLLSCTIVCTRSTDIRSLKASTGDEASALVYQACCCTDRFSSFNGFKDSDSCMSRSDTLVGGEAVGCRAAVGTVG